MSYKSVPEECPTRVSQNSAPQELPTRVTHKSVLQVSHKSVLQECPTRVSCKSAPQECPTRVTHKSFLQECPTRVSRKSVPEECPTRVSYKSVIWAYGTCLHSGSWVPSCFSLCLGHCVGRWRNQVVTCDVRGHGFGCQPLSVGLTTMQRFGWFSVEDA